MKEGDFITAKKPEYKKVQNGPKNSIPKDFIPNTCAPDNNPFFDDTFNPLSSKGNSVLADDKDLFQI